MNQRFVSNFILVDTVIGLVTYLGNTRVTCTTNHLHEFRWSCVSAHTIQGTCRLDCACCSEQPNPVTSRRHKSYGYIMKAGNWTEADTLCRTRLWINSIQSPCNGCNATHHSAVWIDRMSSAATFLLRIEWLNICGGKLQMSWKPTEFLKCSMLYLGPFSKTLRGILFSTTWRSSVLLESTFRGTRRLHLQGDKNQGDNNSVSSN
jgi:hypothetical protein